jgi:hypothetical protein
MASVGRSPFIASVFQKEGWPKLSNALELAYLIDTSKKDPDA